MVLKKGTSRSFQIATHIAAWIPLALLVWQYAQGQLGADPIRAVILRTGRYALILLVLSLACTPLQLVSGWAIFVRLRRPLGLYAYMVVGLHLLAFLGLDYGFDAPLIAETLLQKRFIQVGLLAFLILTPLAVTSTRGWIRRLGRNWRRLHRLVYLAAALAVVHYLMVVKADVRLPLLYGAILAALLAFRLPWVGDAISRWRGRRPTPDR